MDSNPTENASPRLERALEAYLAYSDQEALEPFDEFVARHEDLRDLLEAMHTDEPADAAAAAPAASGTLRTMGDFVLESEIGRGGMGVVYRARQTSVGRTVALKVLPAHLTLDAHAITRFQREASLAARLSHPGIVEIYTVGADAGSHFFAMELVDGVDIGSVLDEIRSAQASDATSLAGLDGERIRQAVAAKDPATRSGSGSVSQSSQRPVFRSGFVETMVVVGLRIAEALQHAHEQQVLHRDVKPSNIMLCRDGRAVLTDFGLAREHALPSMTMTGDFVGTPYYAAPEQATGAKDQVGPWSDVFALGATLYEMVTLHKAFPGDTPLEVIQRIQNTDPVEPQLHNRNLAPDLCAVILRALEKNPAARYPDAGALADDLRAFLDFRPVQARRSTSGARLVRWAQRNRALAITACIAASLLMAGSLIAAIVVTQQNTQIRAARDSAVTVNDFLIKKLILAARPESHQGEKPTVEQVLDHAAEEVGQAFAGSPLLEAEVRDTLGQAWTSLAAYEKALTQLRASLGIRRELQGPEHPETLATWQLLAQSIRLAGRVQEAAAEAAALYDVRRRVLGENHLATWETALTLAQAYRSKDDVKKSEQLLRGCVAARKRALGPHDAATLDAQHQLARTIKQLGRPTEAAELMREVLEVRRRLHSEAKPAIQTSLQDLASVLSDLEEFAEATRYAREGVALAEEIWGKGHPKHISATNTLATEVQELGRRTKADEILAEAEAMFRENLTNRANAFGKDSLSYAVGLNNLGVVLAYRNREKEAIEMFEACIQIRHGKLGPHHRSVVESQANVGAMLYRAKRYERALEVIAAAATHSGKAFGATNPRHANILFIHGNCHMRLGEYAKAAPILRRAHEIFAGAMGEDHRRARQCAACLLIVYEKLGDTASHTAWQQKPH